MHNQSMATYYKQCLLRRGDTQQIVWIPEELAVHGKFVCIGADDDGWLVKCVWQRALRNWLTDNLRDLRKEFASL